MGPKSKTVEPLTVRRLNRVLAILEEHARDWDVPVISFMAAGGASPFHQLVATLMSARTKDETTAAAAPRLFALADTPAAMAALPVRRIEKAIHPVGFYKTKARHIKKLCAVLLADFDGRVPEDVDTLCTLPGVGRKTANLVVALAFDKPAICVDTHVHRISNIWGFVETKTPEQTERALRATLPRRHWKRYNPLLVAFGQHTCTPTSPWCSRCPVARSCPRIGVPRSR